MSNLNLLINEIHYKNAIEAAFKSGLFMNNLKNRCEFCENLHREEMNAQDIRTAEMSDWIDENRRQMNAEHRATYNVPDYVSDDDLHEWIMARRNLIRKSLYLENVCT